jgi:hypothetical protein
VAQRPAIFFYLTIFLGTFFLSFVTGKSLYLKLINCPANLRSFSHKNVIATFICSLVPSTRMYDTAPIFFTYFAVV